MKVSQEEVRSVPLWKQVVSWMITARLVSQSTSALTISPPEFSLFKNTIESIIIK